MSKNMTNFSARDLLEILNHKYPFDEKEASDFIIGGSKKRSHYT